jgi:hypothetical protein
MSSAAETEVGSIFSNAKEAAPLRVMLEEMGHRQPPTPIQTENSTAYGILNNKLNEKSLKAMDMRFYWVRGWIAQKQYRVYWEPGGENLADYFTKHHSPTHHKEMRRQYVHNKLVPMIRINAAALKHTARVCWSSYSQITHKELNPKRGSQGMINQRTNPTHIRLSGHLQSILSTVKRK